MSVYIIIVTYNGMQWLDHCLKSCASYPVIIVDNASTDETVSFIETNYPKVILLKQSENLGFGKANNIGIRYALDQDADHVFLLNQDAFLVDNVLEELMVFQNNNPDYGILSPIHTTSDRTKLDKRFSNFMLKEKSGQFYSDFVLGNKLAPVYEVPFVNAAAWLLSRKCLETVGGFDPLFFHYGEDDNYCQRVLYHELKIGILPQCYIIHDREKRKTDALIAFSDAYYKSVETKYKVKFANILVPNAINKQIVYLKRTILKLQLQAKFKRAKGFRSELVILKNLVSKIKNSRDQNEIKKSHYL